MRSVKLQERISVSPFARSILFVLFYPLLLCGCPAPDSYLPEEPLPPPEREHVEQQVIMEEELIYSPAPRENGTPPPECDYIRFVRFGPASLDEASSAADAVLILIPGFMGGLGDFTYLAEQLVAMSLSQERGNLEVWAVERRANCLEDLTGMNASEDSQDPDIARDYYFSGGTVSGTQFTGFLQEEDVPFLSEFGLTLLMDDLYTIITEKIPDPEVRKQALFIGGHSLGASLAAAFAGWDFDNDPETVDDAGFNNCAGLIGLDGSLSAGTGSGGDERTYADHIAALRSGTEKRVFSFQGLAIPPEAMAIYEILGMYAWFAPDEEATFFRHVSVSSEVQALVRTLHAGTLDAFVTGTPGIADFRYTNEALLGVFADDNFQPISIFQASLGFLAGGPVIRKDFLAAAGMFSGVGWFFQADGLFAAQNSDNKTLYAWANFDTVGNQQDPLYQDRDTATTLTTMYDEVTDILDFAGTLFQGPSNFFEWYFPSRLLYDIQVAGAGFAEDYDICFFHQDVSSQLPRLSLRASDIEGYNHLDFLCAAADRPGLRENEIIEPLLEFIFSTSALKFRAN